MAGDSAPSDEEMVRRALAGDDKAFASLFDRHFPAYRRAVSRRLPPVVRGKLGASDVIQDAYIAAFSRLHEFEERGEGSFRRWLRRIVERKTSNGIRTHVASAKRDARREERISTGDGGVEPAARRRSPSETAIAREEQTALNASMDALPEDYRTVIQHVHRDGVTLVVAAERMGRSPDAVRKLYSRAMARLAEEMRSPPGAGA